MLKYIKYWFTKQEFKQFLKWSLRFSLLLFILDIGYLASVWPDWETYKSGPVQQSSFIKKYQSERKQNNWPILQWTPVAFSRISKNMTHALIVAEDSNFYWHDGIDFKAFQAAMLHNLKKGRFVYGGSTISQQTVKNIFFTASRDPLRKWHELVLTIAMERNLSKQRILEWYLNVVEFGRGIYGVEAAARHYWGVSASRLTRQQAILLAASLPAPSKHNPATQTRFFKRQVQKIERYF